MSPTTATFKSAARWLRRRPALRRGLPLIVGLSAALALAAMSGWSPPAPLDTAAADGGRVAGPHRTATPAAPAERLATRRPAAPPVIAAAGDIACDPASRSFRGGKGAADQRLSRAPLTRIS